MYTRRPPRHVLVVDDAVERRVEIARVLLERASAERALLLRELTTGRAAIEHAQQGFAPRYDLVLLDHDLQDFEVGPEGQRIEWTGEHVAGAIAEMPADKRPKSVVVQSWNRGGALAIARVLTGANVETLILPYGEQFLAYLRRWFDGPA